MNISRKSKLHRLRLRNTACIWAGYFCVPGGWPKCSNAAGQPFECRRHFDVAEGSGDDESGIKRASAGRLVDARATAVGGPGQPDRRLARSIGCAAVARTRLRVQREDRDKLNQRYDP
jgi:hypothetical protein